MDPLAPGEDERALAEAVRRFAVAELAPRAAALDASAAFVGEHLPALGALGVLGLNLPESLGGAGGSTLAVALAVEEIAAACAATASTVTAHYLATDALLAAPSGVAERLLPAAARGAALGAFALTEPAAGSNPVDMRSRAERARGGWRLVGEKHFITNGGVADFVVVFAKTDPAARHRGIGAFVVEKGMAGFTAGPPEPTMGLRASHVFPLRFDVTVPDENLIGTPDQGFRIAMSVLDRGRIDIAAMGLGIARAALAAAAAWLHEREVSGRPLADYQGLRWMLADMATALEAGRGLTHRAARARDAGEPFAAAAAMAKLFVSEAAGRITDAALQIHGGYGYTRAFPLERLVRDARILRIFEGTSEIQREIIARDVLRSTSGAAGGSIGRG